MALEPAADTLFGRRVLGSTRLLSAFSKESGLSRGARLCYLLMCALGRDSGKCYASTITLARLLRSSTRQVERWLSALRAGGWIRPEWRPGRPTSYAFLVHPTIAELISPTPDKSVGGPLTTVSGAPDRTVEGCIGSKERKDASKTPSSSELNSKVGSSGKRTTKPTTTTTQLHKLVKAEIWGYMQGDSPRIPPPPDTDIVRDCIKGLYGHSLAELHKLLEDRYRHGCRPGLARGPRNYAWFVRVIDNYFRPP